jgi:hypothetical protein
VHNLFWVSLLLTHMPRPSSGDRVTTSFQWTRPAKVVRRRKERSVTALTNHCGNETNRWKHRQMALFVLINCSFCFFQFSGKRQMYLCDGLRSTQTEMTCYCNRCTISIRTSHSAACFADVVVNLFNIIFGEKTLRTNRKPDILSSTSNNTVLHVKIYLLAMTYA